MNLAALLLLPSGHIAAAPSLPPVVPKPVSMHVGTGRGFTVSRNTLLVDENGTTASALLQSLLKRGAGFTLKTAKHGNTRGAISLIKAPKGALRQGEYKLHSGSDGIRIWFGDKGGAVYAVQTLRQLLPQAIEGPKPSTTTKWSVPAIEITDYPRFSWRGMHLDVSRHFFQPSFIEKYLDYISMMKMNVFHWHLVDDGGWRIEIEKYPKLTSVGAWRYGITTGWDQSKLSYGAEAGAKYGGFYTKAQVREIVKYAEDRDINVVPEIEMPGHTMPVFAAYPDLMCQNQPASAVSGQPSSNVYCVGNEKTFGFIQDVLDEVMDMFPSKWIHIGGDEVDKSYWHRCSLCQEKMKAEGLKNEESLQSYFVKRIDKYLASKGRRLMGWDEILEGGLAPGATVMSWRGIDGGIAAAKSGHDVVMSPTSHCYFDFAYSGQSTEHVYTFDPVPAALNATQAKHVLGGQANVWTEWIPTEARAEFMIWPRMGAMAETLWSPKAGRDTGEFMGRVSSLFGRLDRLGSSYFLPAPQVAMSAILFKGKAKVEAIQDKQMPGKLHYTIDGTVPTLKSPLYTKPVTVTKAASIRFAYLTPSGKPGDIAQVDCLPAHTEKVANLQNGWKAAYYEGSWTAVPNFAKLKPVISGFMNRIGFDIRHHDENFALDLNGYFKAPKDGVYHFEISSDDGSILKVGGATVINHDGPHGGTMKDGNVWLPKGWHKIEIGYYQGSGAYSLSLAVKVPGTSKIAKADSFVYSHGPGRD